MKKAKIDWKHNVSYKLLDKDGNVKKIFKYNLLGKIFSRLFGFAPKIPLVFGSLVSTMMVENIITNTGKAALASRVNGDGSAAIFDHIALGVGTTSEAVGDTALESEITSNGGSRAQGATSRTTTTVENDTARVSKTFTFTGSLAITESGLLNAASGGTLLARQVFSPINVVDTDELVVTWDLNNA